MEAALVTRRGERRIVGIGFKGGKLCPGHRSVKAKVARAAAKIRGVGTVFGQNGQNHQNGYLRAMKTRYTPNPTASARVRELPTISATALKNSTADVLDEVVARRAVAITRHDKPRAVLLSVEQYEALAGLGKDWLDGLMQEYRVMLDRMQSPEQKDAALRAFRSAPEELGAAALRAARRESSEPLP
jgi:prevent-host-death family protein